MSDSILKAMGSRDDSSKLVSAYYHVRWLWTDYVWYAHAPVWLLRSCRVVSDFCHDQVTCRIWPRQAWLTKVAGRTWHDKPELIPTILYAAVIHFVEEEDCFGVTNWAGSGLAEEEKQLKEIYQWAKTGRAKFQERIMAAYPPMGRDDDEDIFAWLNRKDPVRDACYVEVHRIEAEMEEWDNRCLGWVVKNRKILWS